MTDTWKPNWWQRLLFRRAPDGWHWTRRAEFAYRWGARRGDRNGY